MISKRRRETNKSRGPWGLHDYNVTYFKPGDTIERHRFIQAHSPEEAEEQFIAIMKKDHIKPESININEV